MLGAELRNGTTARNRRLADEFFDVGGFAGWFVAGIGVTAVDALFSEAGATPDEIVDGALEVFDAVFEVRWGGHGSERVKG